MTTQKPPYVTTKPPVTIPFGANGRYSLIVDADDAPMFKSPDLVLEWPSDLREKKLAPRVRFSGQTFSVPRFILNVAGNDQFVIHHDKDPRNCTRLNMEVVGKAAYTAWRQTIVGPPKPRTYKRPKQQPAPPGGSQYEPKDPGQEPYTRSWDHPQVQRMAAIAGPWPQNYAPPVRWLKLARLGIVINLDDVSYFDMATPDSVSICFASVTTNGTRKMTFTAAEEGKDTIRELRRLFDSLSDQVPSSAELEEARKETAAERDRADALQAKLHRILAKLEAMGFNTSKLTEE